MQITVRTITLVLLAAVALIARAGALEAEREMASMLVAKPQFHDPIFGRTVLLVTALKSGAHVGVIVNRPTQHSLASLFPEFAPSKRVRDPVYFGGPVLPESILAVVRAKTSPGEGSIKITDDLFLVAHAAVIDGIIEKTPNEARYFVGAVVWQAGELRQEIERGYWSVIDVDAKIIFNNNPQETWKTLRRKASAVMVEADIAEIL